MQIHFTKMEGCGNDYIYINGFVEQIPQERKKEAVRILSDRHFGIGGDGVIFINPSRNADFEMEMYNQDGSRAEMCGNGIRCVGKYVYDHGMTSGKETITVESFGKVRKLELFCKDGKAEEARVNMGKPVLAPSEIPVLPSSQNAERVIEEPICVGGELFRITCVSMGNPHAVIFLTSADVQKLAKKDSLSFSQGKKDTGDSFWEMNLSQIGPCIEQNKMFPNKTNVEFVEVLNKKQINMRVWERGSGETLACGTGSCASVVAGVLTGRTDRCCEVCLKGGTLKIEWMDSGEIFLTGPARECFEGTARIFE